LRARKRQTILPARALFEKSIGLNINMLDESNMVFEMYNIKFEMVNKDEPLLVKHREKRMKPCAGRALEFKGTNGVPRIDMCKEELWQKLRARTEVC